jgi:hypothetical protein
MRACLVIKDELSEQFRFAVKPAPEYPTDYLSKHSAFCIINGKNYWVKINSVAKRLGISSSTVRDNVYFYGPNSWLKHILLTHTQIEIVDLKIAQAKAENLKRIIGDKSPVTVEELMQMVCYANDHPDQTTDQLQGPLTARTIGFKTDGSRWIHLNRCNKGDRVVGSGLSKTAKYTINIETGELAIRTTEGCFYKYHSRQWKEVGIIRFLHENKIPNIIKIYHVQVKPSKKESSKGCRYRFEIIKELCPGGELCKRIDHNGIAIDPVKFIEELFCTIMAMAKLNMYIRDLRPANILVSKSGDPVIADFGYTVKCDPEAVQCDPGSDLDHTSMLDTIKRMGKIINLLFSTFYKTQVTMEQSLTLEAARDNFRRLAAQLSLSH